MEKGKLFIKKSAFEDSTLFCSRRSAWSVLKCNKSSEVFPEFSGWDSVHSMAKKITFLKGNLSIYKSFIDVLIYTFFLVAKEKLQNVPRF